LVKRTPRRLAASLALSAGLGLWALYRTAPERGPTTTPSPKAQTTQAARAPYVDDALGRKLRQVRTGQAGAARAAAFVAALAEAAAHDPARAVHEAMSLGDADGRMEAVHECLPLWLARDAESARAYLLTHIAALPLELAEAVARDAAAHDPQLGLALAQQLHVGARPRAVHAVFVQWAGSSPKAAAQAAESLLPSEGQVRVIGEVARIWSEQAPADAQRWAAALPSQGLRREALLPVVDSWADKDPKAAAEALLPLADEGYKQRLVDSVVGRWAEQAPDDARAFLTQLSSPTLRAAGAVALAASLLEREPARAASWALELSGDVHSELVEKTLTAWVARDPAAARSWAEEQPQEQGKALLALVQAREHKE
jgi:hypothetical protein